MTTLLLGEGVGLDQQANLQILVIRKRGSKLPCYINDVQDSREAHHNHVIPSEA